MKKSNVKQSAAETYDPITELPKLRRDAFKQKSTKYFTGKPCHKGHTTYRYTASALCASCAHGYYVRFGVRPVSAAVRKKINDKWNASAKGKNAKQRWAEKNPKRYWAVSVCGGAKERAKKLGVPFNLNKDYVYALTPDVCPVFGTPFVFRGSGVGGMSMSSATLDRLAPAKGYVRGNVAVVSMKANAIKSNASAEEIRKVADWLEAQGK
jgi:hypothetical protein